MPVQPGAIQPTRTQPAGPRPEWDGGGPRDSRRRRSSRRQRRAGRPGRWGTLQGGLGVCIVVAGAAIGAIATIVTRSMPGVLLGLCVVAGTIVAALAVRPRTGRMILPVPVLSYLVAALISGFVIDPAARSSSTELAVAAAQWVANGFFAMALATALAVVIIVARWFLWRRRRPDTRGPGWPVPAAGAAQADTGRDGTGRRPRATWETSAEPGYPAGLAGPGGTRETGPRASGPTQSGPTQSGPTQSGPTQSGPTQSGPTQSGPTQSGPRPNGPRPNGPRPNEPRPNGPRPNGPGDSGESGWGDAGRRGMGPRPGPPAGRPGSGPYNFSSGA
jgi:Domain of unknown function (DUF6542)